MARVSLRRLQPEDVNEQYLSWFADDQVTRFLSVDGKALTADRVRDYIKEGLETGNYYMYAICLSETGQHIGNLKLGPIDRKHGVSDLVAVIGAREYWGQGLATEAIRLGNEMAFKDYGLRKLAGSIYSSNIGSIKAYTKAGWVVEGTRKAHYKHGETFEDEVFVSCFNPEFHPELAKTT